MDNSFIIIIESYSGEEYHAVICEFSSYYKENQAGDIKSIPTILARDRDTRKPATGFVFLLNSISFSWLSKRPTTSSPWLHLKYKRTCVLFGHVWSLEASEAKRVELIPTFDFFIFEPLVREVTKIIHG